MRTQEVPARSILNPTSGFLRDGFTHTIKLYRGCALGNSPCGRYCYAKWNRCHTLGRPWDSFLDVKTGVREAYRRDYDRLKARDIRRPGTRHSQHAAGGRVRQEQQAPYERETEWVEGELATCPRQAINASTMSPTAPDVPPVLPEDHG